MKPYYEHAGITIYHGDCREVLPDLESANLVFTSPPYADQRNYESGFSGWDQVVPAILPLLKDLETQIFVNLGLVYRNGEVLEYWRSLFESARSAGWRLFGWYVWDKGSALPGDWGGRFAPAHEFIFHLNRTSRRPNKLVRCTYQGSEFLGKIRKPDGSMSIISKPGPVPEFKIPDSVVRMYPARSPEEDRKSTRLNSSHLGISYAVFCLKKKNKPSKYNDVLRRAVGLFTAARHHPGVELRLEQHLAPREHEHQRKWSRQRLMQLSNSAPE